MRGKGDHQSVVCGPTSGLMDGLVSEGWYVGLSWVVGRMGLATVGDKWDCGGDGRWQRLATCGTALELVLAIVGDQWDCVGAREGHSR